MKLLLRTSCVVLLALCSALPLETWAASNLNREVAILDVTVRNRETSNSHPFSAEHVLKVAGVPYIITDDIVTATQYSMVVISSVVRSYTFKKADRTLLDSYVSDGGILFIPRLLESRLNHIAGITGTPVKSTRRYFTHWNKTGGDPSLQWINDSLEETISLGRESFSTDVISTWSYQTNGASILAWFDDSTIAVTKFKYGKGYVYCTGFSIKDLVLTNQLNGDYEAQRTYSNGFEPTSDVFMMFMRGIYTSHITHGTWKYTIPGTCKSSVMVTHDMDSRSGMDLILGFAFYEYAMGIHATYFMTTHYFKDYFSGDFYTPNIWKLDTTLKLGHTIASHSVGHFIDFGDETTFPLGTPGLTKATYSPRYHGRPTIGGNVYGELQVSRDLLETDLNTPIRSFRSGYLAFNDLQANVLNKLDYNYCSSMSANDVLTNFPYQMHENRAFSGDLTEVYEIPMTISDVFRNPPISASNYQDKVDSWLEVIEKNADNHAPTNLLIHPNRIFKFQALQSLVSQMPSDVSFIDLESYGEYWKAREAFTYLTEMVNDSVMKVIIPSNQLPLHPGISIIISDGQNLHNIMIEDEFQQPVALYLSNWEQDDAIIHSNIMNCHSSSHKVAYDYNPFENFVHVPHPSLLEQEDHWDLSRETHAGEDEEHDLMHKMALGESLGTLFKVYPNPASEQTTLAYFLSEASSDVSLSVLSSTGQHTLTILDHKKVNAGSHSAEINISALPAGIYICKLTVEDEVLTKKLLVTH